MMNTQIGKEKITVTHPQTYSRLYDFFLADAVAAYHGGIDVDAVNEFVEHTLPYIAKVARTLDVISIPLSIFFCLNWFQCQGQFFDSNRYKITTVTGEKSVSTAWPPY